MLALLSGKVLGQFDPFTSTDGRGRLLLVAPNVLHHERRLKVDPSDFRLWVALHEQTHALQFAAAPWLADHLRSRAAELLTDLAADKALVPRVGELLGAVTRAVTGGADDGVGVLDLLSPRQRDGVRGGRRGDGPARGPRGRDDGRGRPARGAERAQASARRSRRDATRRPGPAGVDRVLRRLLGLDTKLAQYRDGAAFVRAVRKDVGLDGLNAVWTSAGPPAAAPGDRRPAGVGAPGARVTGSRSARSRRCARRSTAAVADLPPDALVLVACSGGPDSLALAAGDGVRRAAVQACGDAVARAAVVVDHGLQEGSAQVADDAAAACRGLGLPAVVVRVRGRRAAAEAAARDARYAALDRVADELGAAVVLLGHTLDDQAETVLLGLARGSGARALAGMPATRGRFRRPLLGLRRADTLAACAALDLQPWHDPTNDGAHADASLRSRVRDDALPTLERVLGPGVAEALARSAAQLRDDADLLDALADDLLAAARTADGAGRRASCDEAPPRSARRALRSAAIAAGSPAGALGRAHVLAVDALVTDWHGQGPVALPGGIAVSRACGRLALDTAPA